MPKRSDDILVLDDEVNYAEMLVHLLESEGFRTDMRTNPEEALEALKTRSYSLIVSDFKMPALDGAEFLKGVRELYPDLPVIMVSGYMNMPELLRVANIGVTLVLEKPFDTAVFLEHIRRFADPHVSAPAIAGGETQAGSAPEGKAARSYPSGKNLVSEASEVSRDFLQSFWDGFETGMVGVVVPHGSEVALLLRDAGRWKNLKIPAQRFAPAQVRTDEALELADDVLTVLDARFTRELDDISDLATRLRDQMRPDSPLIVLLPAENALPEAVFPIVEMPPLSSRLEDVAVYARQVLQRSSRQGRLQPDAIRVLLSYSWPGNYDELYAVMRRAVLHSDHGELMAADVEEAISEGSGLVPPGAEDTTLDVFLRRKQAEFLMAQDISDPAKALEAVGADPSALDSSRPLTQQDLLYPGVLSGEG